MCLAACYWARVDHVYYANTRDDAAAIGFDDCFFYEELERPYAERSLCVSRMEIEGSLAPLRAWQSDSAKTQY